MTLEVDLITRLESIVQCPRHVTHLVALVHPIRQNQNESTPLDTSDSFLLSYLIQCSGYLVHYYPSLEIAIPICSESLHFQVETFEDLHLLFVFTKGALKVSKNGKMSHV